MHKTIMRELRGILYTFCCYYNPNLVDLVVQIVQINGQAKFVFKFVAVTVHSNKQSFMFDTTLVTTVLYC